jgi:mannose/fructose/N-acetylgalactosamine-specific phosphotransferase system component IIC
MISWLTIGVLGALVGLDSTAFPQAMFSRPLVAATLAGLAFGRPLHGLMVGVALEIFALVILPVGAARYPEAGPGAVAAAAAFVSAATYGPPSAVLLLAVVFGLAWERMAGVSVILLRRENERLVARDVRQPPGARGVERRHLGAMAIDLLRGAVVALAGSMIGVLLLRALGPLWALRSMTAAGLLTVAATAMLAAALPLFGGFKERRVVFLAGLVCGSLLLLLA